MVCLVNVVGRILLASIFIAAGVNHFLHFEQELPFITSKITTIHPELAQFSQYIFGYAIFASVAGGLLTILNYRKIAALLLVSFLVPVTALIHNFWEIKDPVDAQTHQISFMKNAAILGGILILASQCSKGSAATCAGSVVPQGNKNANNNNKKSQAKKDK